jgi:3-dehydroquinate synthase
MKNISINLKDVSYNIFIEEGLLNKLGSLFKQNFKSKKVVIVTDDNVNKYYGDKVLEQFTLNGFDTHKIVLKHGEKSKSLSVAEQIYGELVEFNINRDSMLVALGGGVIGDLTGFVASTFLRGIKYVQIPTSLLAQVDSSVGGKVAVNLNQGKNLVGSFYHPSAVFIDPIVLNTLEKRFFSDGMSEVIKYGCIKDEVLFNRLDNNIATPDNEKFMEEIIYTCCNIKKMVVEKDEKDLGDRMILNFGHTIGHAIEKYYNFSNYSHGEGVAIGMYNICKISESKGLTIKDVSDRIRKILIKYNLPYDMPNVEQDEILKAIKTDKKTMDKGLNFIIIEDIGKVFLHNVKSEDIEQFLKMNL